MITLYGIAEKNRPTHITLFKTYADSVQYKAHLSTPHFQKYKQGTLTMVKHVTLISMHSLFYHSKPSLETVADDKLYVRLIKIEIASNAVEAFRGVCTKIMAPGLEREPGMLVMYAVAEKDRPTHISILEVYQNLAACQTHLDTPHYCQYQESAKLLVKSWELVEAAPVLLGAKAQP